MILRRVFLAAALGLAAPAAARACMVGDAFRALIHRRLPGRLPHQAVALEVRFIDHDERRLYRKGLRARVSRVIQGEGIGPVVLVRETVWTSCDYPFLNGTSGLLVCVLRGKESGMSVLHPVMVTQGSGFRLSDDFELSDFDLTGELKLPEPGVSPNHP